MTSASNVNDTAIRCQRQSAAALVQVIGLGAKAKLPCVSWKLGYGVTLVAQCLNTDMQERRAAFLAWAKFLGIADWRSTEHHGVTHLHGVTEEAFDGGVQPRCRVVLTADLYDNGLGDRP